MTDFEMKVTNDVNVETVLKAIIKETSEWGFRNADYLKLINALLDQSLSKSKIVNKSSIDNSLYKKGKVNFPLSGEQIKVRIFDKAAD
ncbi:MAG: hypothetical protein ABI638_07890, partial [Ignavibacteriota bacterium]